MSNVLIVDDEKNVLLTLSIGLRRFNYTVYEAQSGPDALRLMKETNFEVVVSDIRMAPMDGYTLARTIKKQYPETIIILMSAYGFEEEESGEVSKYPRLTKPFKVTDLVEIIKKEEEKYVRRGKILIFAERENGRKIQEVVEEDGFSSEIFSRDSDAVKQIRSIRDGIFIIDEELLSSCNCQILNQIDQNAPDRPVIIISKKKGKKNFITNPDLAVTVLDRDMFFNDHIWALDHIKNSMFEHN